MINDAMLKQAAEELAIAINESLPDPKECVYQFSPKFEKKLKRLTRRASDSVSKSTDGCKCITGIFDRIWFDSDCEY